MLATPRQHRGATPVFSSTTLELSRSLTSRTDGGISEAGGWQSGRSRHARSVQLDGWNQLWKTSPCLKSPAFCILSILGVVTVVFSREFKSWCFYLLAEKHGTQPTTTMAKCPKARFLILQLKTTGNAVVLFIFSLCWSGETQDSWWS